MICGTLDEMRNKTARFNETEGERERMEKFFITCMINWISIYQDAISVCDFINFPFSFPHDMFCYQYKHRLLKKNINEVYNKCLRQMVTIAS